MKRFKCHERRPTRCRLVPAIARMPVLAFAGSVATASWVDRCGAEQITYEIVATFGLGNCGPFTHQQLSSMSINNNAEVVGFYSPCALGTPRPFYWSPATGLLIPQLDPDFDDTRLYDINDAGVACGARVLTSTGLGWEAVLYQDGEWTGLGMLPDANQSVGAAINEVGTVAGFSLNVITGPLRAMRADRQGMVDLNPLIPGVASEAFAVNDVGTITGFAAFGGLRTRQGFILHGESVTLVPAFPDTINAEVVGINNAGDAIARGRATADIGNFIGYVRIGGVWSPLPVPPGYIYFVPWRIGNGGVVVGHVFDVRGSGKGAVFIGGTTHVLEDVALESEQFRIFAARGVNDDGWIVCDAKLLTTPFSTAINLVLRPISGLVGDLNFDCKVDATDLAIMLGAWGSKRVGADLDADGVVGAADVALLLDGWTTL
jgi:hypothetical protein